MCRQRIVPIEEISIEDIEDSNMWTVTTPGVQEIKYIFGLGHFLQEINIYLGETKYVF